MAFSRDNLTLLAYGNGVRHWHFKDTASTLAQIATADYFLTVIDEIFAGDFFFLEGSDGYAIAVCNANTGSSIDLANVTQLDSADTA